jgi:phage-related protein
MGPAIGGRVGCCSSPIFQKTVDSKGLWEVRIQFGNDIFRLLGFFDGGALLILTNGFVKKTQKTPPQEIGLAIRRKEEYLARRKSHE